MRVVVIASIALLVAWGIPASAARPAIPPGCLKHPSTPGCVKYFPPPPKVPAVPNVPAVPALPTLPTTSVSAEVAAAVAKLTPSAKTGIVFPTGTISVAATIIAVRSAVDAGEVGAVRATYAQLWNRRISAKPIGYAVTTCYSIGEGGALGRAKVEECHAYYAMPRGKIVAAGVSFSRRNYWLPIIGGTGIYLHGAGWAHYDHGRLTITFSAPKS